MLSGAFSAKTKDGTIYYRSSLTYKRKHISLGSFPTEEEAHLAYKEGTSLLSESEITLENYTAYIKLLDFAKAITLLNFRDNGVYIKNPIYLKQNYFSIFSHHRRNINLILMIYSFIPATRLCSVVAGFL